MRVKDVMTPKVICVGPDEAVGRRDIDLVGIDSPKGVAFELRR